ncbi:zinc finger protein 48-like [Ochlerotatus camptorhynchus]|uniref:zinc finger protein 48-like n=1 Tax=Ochlerotatus camptorhynchus TaxID=644619 RepID=UPI0031D7C622
MVLHERTVHLKEKPFICPICEKPYTDRSCWRKHIATHESPQGVKPVPIRVKSIRPKEVKPKVVARVVTPAENKPRQRRNTGPKRYNCDLCDKMFARRRNVQHHMTYTHNKIKPHECQFCGKKYSDITSFKRHIRGHTDPEVQRPTQQAPEATMVNELLVGDLTELEFTPEGSDDTITFIVITDG